MCVVWVLVWEMREKFKRLETVGQADVINMLKSGTGLTCIYVDRFMCSTTVIPAFVTLRFISPFSNKQAGHRVYGMQYDRFSQLKFGLLVWGVVQT